MKKKRIALITLVLVGLLFACSSLNDDRTDDHENEATFIGTIEEINGDNALVSIEKGEILKSGRKVDVNLSVTNDTKFEIGDKIKVGFDGVIRETFPLGINTTFVELVK